MTTLVPDSPPDTHRIRGISSELARYLANLEASIAQRSMMVNINTASVTLTNQVQAEDFFSAGTTNRIGQASLTRFTQARLIARVTTGSASANTPKLRAVYRTAFSSNPANWLDLGATEISVSMTTAGIITSAWTDLATLARADVLVTVLESGGDTTADPAVAWVGIEFR